MRRHLRWRPEDLGKLSEPAYVIGRDAADLEGEELGERRQARLGQPLGGLGLDVIS